MGTLARMLAPVRAEKCGRATRENVWILREFVMKAAVLYEANKPLVIEDVSINKPGPREVLIRTAVAGLCHSDLHFMEGLYPYPLPAILGHESSGVVEQVGADVTYVKPGDHVVTCLSVFCGTCDMCTTGRPVLCTGTDVKLMPGVANRFSWGRKEKLNQFLNLSSFAEQMLVHENAIVKIRKDMPLDLAALIGCGVITGYGAVVNTAGVRPGETVAVIGCGGVGMAAINGAAIAGAGRIIAVDTNPAKLQLATKLGATDLVNPKDGDPVAKVKEITGGGVQYSFEVLGAKITAEQAFGMLAPGGTATVVGMIPVGTKVELHGADFLREKRMQGSSMGSNHFRQDMPRLVEFYLNGKLHLDDWVSAKIKLSEINEGFANMKAGKVVRSVIQFN
jgi:S-(hydroxymethyl)glutathione dehydrogenase / alcohol dehydrogenase